MGGPAFVVDVVPVGRGVDDHDVGARSAQGLGGDGAGGPVGAVDDDSQAGQFDVDRSDEVLDVSRVRHFDGGFDPAHAFADGPVPFDAEEGFDLVLDGVFELEPAAREELDAVVGHGVVRGGDHHAEVDVLRGCEVGQPRGGQHVDVFDVDAGACQACRDGLREHGPGQARVAGDDRSRAPFSALCKSPGGGVAQFECQLCRNLAVGEPPHAVGSKKSGHDSSPVREKIAIVTIPSMSLPRLSAELLHNVSRGQSSQTVLKDS